ncbi:unnamed protein product [Spirodela intermedia]|uniref:non-specific serine/threonine protein kinase n=1 Tax=Spirodela intermedia TaxID=51605 RepID=A0A7I8JH29_SPIIN|nr:unnamed protein product [Spirodela intermedia]CAA6669446.1 unnamed protein product [Spirodela intermedia]
MNLTYASSSPWNTSSCLPETNNLAGCCSTLLTLFAVGLARRLRETGRFRLPDLPTSAACLADFQSNLTALSLPSTLVPSCFPPRGSSSTRPPALASRPSTTGRGSSGTPPPCTPPARTSSPPATGAGSASRLARPSSPSGRPSAEDCGKGLSTLQLCLTIASVVFAVISAILAAAAYLRRFRKKNQGEEEQGRRRAASTWYDIKELEKATRNFSEKNVIGRSAFGVVYRGTLSDGSRVAVKKMIESEFQGDEEFRNEMEIIGDLRHRNLVPLRGSCIVRGDEEEDGGRSHRYLIYEYMPYGSLHQLIFPEQMKGSRQRRLLTWSERKRIILDVAEGLCYLHYGVKPAIFHRDVKPTNILLDGDMRARVADFGLARQNRAGAGHITTRVAGTVGYLAPEYALYGRLTEKSDVYSFGMVVLEVMSGRKALERSPSEMVLLADWAWTLVKSGRAHEVLESSLRGGGEERASAGWGTMERFVRVGVLCANVAVALRPTMREAKRMLEGDIDLVPIPDRRLPLCRGFPRP